MDNRVTVLEVIEINNCAGAKKVYVTTDSGGSQVKTVFEMTKTWLPPINRIELMMVSPTDVVEIYINNFDKGIFLHEGEAYTIQGEFTRIVTDITDRLPMCRCSKPLWSDGFEVYCKDTYCPMTTSSRLERLANTVFYDSPELFEDQVLSVLFPQNDESNVVNPFGPIADAKFWGKVGRLDDIFLHLNISPLLPSFLVPDMFKALLSDSYVKPYISQVHRQNIDQFYGYMIETVSRRDYSSTGQNKLIAMFLWSLGIEALKPFHIQALVKYECDLSNEDPMLIYAYCLTRTPELIQELGFHPLEAQAIVSEVYNRRHELYDIFRFYTANQDDLLYLFDQIK